MDNGTYPEETDSVYGDYYDSFHPLHMDAADLQSGQCNPQRLSSLTPVWSSLTPVRRNHGPGGPSTDQMLATLLDSQNKVVKMVESVSKRMTDLESIVTGLTYKLTENNSLPSSSSSPDERRRLPPQLSKTVAKIHEAFDDDKQFRPNRRSKDKHNRDVKRRLAEEISLCKENMYSSLVDRAIQRYFESRRRTWRESTDPTQLERVTMQNKRRNVRAHKQRLFECRLKVTHSGEERKRFSALSLEHMSNESSSDGGETMVLHQPSWRSNTLCEYLMELDQRAADVNSIGGKKKNMHQLERTG